MSGIPASIIAFVILNIVALHGSQITGHRRSIDAKLDVNKDIKEPMQQMFRSGQIKTPPSKEKIEKIKTSKKQLMDKVKENESSGRKVGVASNGIAIVMGGIPHLLNGITNDDFTTALTGMVNIVCCSQIPTSWGWEARLRILKKN